MLYNNLDGWDGGWGWDGSTRGRRYMYKKTDSRSFIAETNTTLENNYSPIKSKFFKKLHKMFIVKTLSDNRKGTENHKWSSKFISTQLRLQSVLLKLATDFKSDQQ